MSKKILIVAGEPSGDLHGSLLVRSLLSRDSSLQFEGIGGEKMARAGVSILRNISKLSIVGFSDVILKLRMFQILLDELNNRLKAGEFDAVIVIDYPGFNMKLAKCAKEAGVPVVYFITPQIWAWNFKRIHKIREYVNLALVIFKFEEELFLENNVNAKFVGHPLLDLIDKNTEKPKEDVLRELGFANASPLIICMPGSRKQEVKAHLPAMLEACRRLQKRFQSAAFVVIKSENSKDKLFDSLIAQCGIKNIQCVRGNHYPVMQAADFAFVCSGTATLETALSKTPMVVVYKTGWLNWFIAKLVVKIKHISLVNIVAGKQIAPELLQRKVKAKYLFAEADEILSNKDLYADTYIELEKIEEILGEPGAPGRAADYIIELLNDEESD